MINDFLAIAIVGAVLAVVVQGLKNWLGTDSWQTKLMTIILALVVGGIYVWLQSTVYYQTVLIVLGAASTVYALVLKQPSTPIGSK